MLLTFSSTAVLSTKRSCFFILSCVVQVGACQVWSDFTIRFFFAKYFWINLSKGNNDSYLSPLIKRQEKMKKYFCQYISNPDKLVKLLIFKEKQCSYYYWTGPVWTSQLFNPLRSGFACNNDWWYLKRLFKFWSASSIKSRLLWTILSYNEHFALSQVL